MIIKRDFLYSPAGKVRTLHIYLPDSYDESSERYPVMYFFDGHNLFFDEDATYGKSWGLKDFLDRWPKKMIVVGMECGHEGNERLKEYSPYHLTGPFWGDIRGIGDATMKWITEEIKPVIDREYRTYSFREATGIAGSSMGGLMSVYAGVRYNEVYSKAACLSSAVGSCMKEIGKDFAACRLDPDTRIWLSWGSEEAGPAERKPGDPKDAIFCTPAGRNNRQLCEWIMKEQAAVKLFCQEGGRHCEADWEKQVPDFMDFLWMG